MEIRKAHLDDVHDLTSFNFINGTPWLSNNYRKNESKTSKYFFSPRLLYVGSRRK
ncbi:hypothetical protein ABES33_27615 [Bacillus pseudomycoides]|uniref:hypothetical protein n=1 Tax=Bacillus pseudomycoides TaxID=64104 RepID=UPI003D20F64A